MKILLTTTGADRTERSEQIVDLASYFHEVGHDVMVASGPGEYLPSTLDQRGIYHVHSKHLSSNPGFFSTLAFVFEMMGFLREEQFDIVHMNSYASLAGALAAKLLDYPPKTVFTFRDPDIITEKFAVGMFKRLFYKLFLSSVDVGVFQCPAAQRAAHDARLRPQREEIIVDGVNAYDLNFLSKPEAVSQLSKLTGIDLKDSLLIGSIGRLSYQKNYEFLIRQMTQFKGNWIDAKCIIIGSGPRRGELEVLIRRLGLEDVVYLVGNHPDPARLLSAFDVFVHPSRYDGLSLRLTEALHAGVPTLVSDVGCIRSVIRDKRLIYKPEEGPEFVRKLEAILENENEELTETIQKHASELTLDRSAGNYLSLYFG